MKIRIKYCLACSQQYKESGISVKIRAGDNEVFFGRPLEIRKKRGTIFSFEEEVVCLSGTTSTTQKPQSSAT